MSRKWRQCPRNGCQEFWTSHFPFRISPGVARERCCATGKDLEKQKTESVPLFTRIKRKLRCNWLRAKVCSLFAASLAWTLHLTRLTAWSIHTWPDTWVMHSSCCYTSWETHWQLQCWKQLLQAQSGATERSSLFLSTARGQSQALWLPSCWHPFAWPLLVLLQFLWARQAKQLLGFASAKSMGKLRQSFTNIYWQNMSKSIKVAVL